MKGENIFMEKKKTKNRIIIVLVVIAVIVISIPILMGVLPFLGFVGVVLWEMLFNIPSAPKITYAEFPFEIVYEYNGEIKTIEDVFICEYEGYSFALDGGNSRDWKISYKNNDNYGSYYIDEEKYPTAYIETAFEAEYYMSAPRIKYRIFR